MKSIKLALCCLTLLFSSMAFSKKVLKVQNKIVIISTTGLSNVEEGAVFKVFSGGYEAGKIKIRKLGRNKALGEITSGSVTVGDTLIFSPDEREAIFKNFSNYAFLGLSMIMPSGTESTTAKPFEEEYSMHTGLSLKYLRGNNQFRYEGAFTYATGTATVPENVLRLPNNAPNNESELDSSFMMVTAGINYFFFPSFYVRANTGIFKGEVTGTINFPGFKSKSDLEFFGLPFLAGAGYEKQFGKFIIQAEGYVNFNYYLTSDINSKESEVASQMFLGLGLLGGMKF